MLISVWNNGNRKFGFGYIENGKAGAIQTNGTFFYYQPRKILREWKPVYAAVANALVCFKIRRNIAFYPKTFIGTTIFYQKHFANSFYNSCKHLANVIKALLKKRSGYTGKIGK